MIEMMGGKIDFWELVKLYCIGFYYGSISPGRAGEFIKGSRLSKIGLQTKEGLISILYERFYDIATPVAFIGIYYPLNVILDIETPMVLLLLGTYFITIILWIIMIHLFRFFKNKIQILRNSDDYDLKLLLKYSLMPSTASILNWACISLTAYLLLGDFGVRIALSRVIFAVCIAMLSVLLPITISGWGIREAAYVWALSPFAEPSVSIIFSITFSLIATYSLAIVGLIYELRVRGNRSP